MMSRRRSRVSRQSSTSHRRLPRRARIGRRRRAAPTAAQPSRGAMSAPKWLPTFWTVGGILSILANLILLSMLISTGRSLGAFGAGGANGGALLSAYSSLEQLDQAHIRATIPVQTNIALDATVPVKSSTTITLAQDVYMEGAHVTINTALFNIDAPANITLPAGTSLDVALDMALPLQTSVPISMDVPVDIAVRDTDLHGAIQGMKDALKPLLCAASPSGDAAGRKRNLPLTIEMAPRGRSSIMPPYAKDPS